MFTHGILLIVLLIYKSSCPPPPFSKSYWRNQVVLFPVLLVNWSLYLEVVSEQGCFQVVLCPPKSVAMRVQGARALSAGFIPS